MMNVNDNDDDKDDTYLREVGTLPEYSSREGCGVEVQDSRKEAGREFGRL